MKAIIKPQYVDHIPKAVNGRVQAVLTAKTELDNSEEMIDLMGGFETPFLSPIYGTFCA